VLERTGERGVYERTPRTAKAIQAYLELHMTVTAKELTARGIPHSQIQSWLRAGVLERTGQRGVYRRTPRTAARLEAYFARAGR